MLSDSTIRSRGIEIIPNKLYWISSKETPRNVSKTFFFNIDSDLVYEPFFFDFGPVDICKVYKFVLEVEALLKCSQFKHSKIYHHTSLDTAKRANAAFLMGAFQVIILNKTAEEAWEPFSTLSPPLASFRDASEGKCDYNCTILDCLKGLEFAIKLGWFDLKKLNSKSCEQYEKMENLDMHWIIPERFVAMSGPSNHHKDSEGHKRCTPEDYISIFKSFNVKKVIQLNSKEYDEKRFQKFGIKHKELSFEHSACPSMDLVDKFIATCEEEKGAIAVHCRSGLGRTGTMIACYAIKHYGFPAASLIAWIRLCRPGSILGKQQKFLIDYEGCLNNNKALAKKQTSGEGIHKEKS